MENNEKILKLSQIIEVKFNNWSLLTEALTHRSYVNEHKDEVLVHNERLEFLGDAVLELSITKFLFNNYADFMEGDLTSFRAALVKTESLAEEAVRLGFGEFLLMSKGEETTGGRERQYILANSVEAIIGAIYQDQGFEIADAFILKNIAYKAEKIIQSRSDIDSKSKLQEITQEDFKVTPNYQLLSAKGPDHNKIFEMGAYLNEKLMATGTGKSKQEAEQSAAKKVIENWDSIKQKLS